jgi:KDO2-lipid IV(A) lauroyltransferase
MASARHRVESAAFAALIGVFRVLPVDAASALGAFLARWLGPVLARRRDDQARRNLARCIGHDVGAIRRAMWAQAGRTFGELPHLKWLATHRVELVGREHLDAALASGRPVLLVAGHLGNWELLPFLAARLGLKLNAVARTASNEASERILARLRAGGAAEVIPKGQAGTRRLVRRLHAGEHFCFLVDQRFSEGIVVPFFGMPAKTTPAAAALAIRHHGTVLPVRCERLGGAHFRVTVEPPIDLNWGAEAATAAINARLEAWIRARPDQWLWTHRRWPEV